MRKEDGNEMTSEMLTKTEFEALAQAIHGSMFDQVSGTRVMREFLMDELSAQATDPSDDGLSASDLYDAKDKIELMSNASVRHLLDAVNAVYRVSTYRALSEIVNSGECLCDDCQRKAELN